MLNLALCVKPQPPGTQHWPFLPGLVPWGALLTLFQAALSWPIHGVCEALLVWPLPSDQLTWGTLPVLGPHCSRLTLRDSKRNSDIWRELWVEPCLFAFKGVVRWFGHLIRLLPGCLPLEIFSGHCKCYENQNMLKRLYISSGLGIIQDPRGGAGRHCWRGLSRKTLLSLVGR